MKNILLHPALPKLRRYIYRLLALGDACIPYQRHLVIFSYHGIGNDAWRFGVSFDEFVRQIEYVMEQGYGAVTLNEVFDAVEKKVSLPKKAFAVTFDDGYRDVLLVRHYLAKKNIHPAIFVLADPLHAERDELGTGREFLTRTEMLQLHKDGWEVGSHSATHADFSTLTPPALEYETKLAKERIERELGIPIRYFAYPKGYNNKKIRSAVKRAGYRGALSMDDGFIGPDTDLFALPRVGVDRTHTMREFMSIFLPASVAFRYVVKALLAEKARLQEAFRRRKLSHL